MSVARESNGVGASTLLGTSLSPDEVLWDPDVKGLFLYEDDPFHYLNQERVGEAIAEKEFLLVGEALPTMSSEAADLVIPTGTYAAKEGTRFAGDGHLRSVKRTVRSGADGFQFLQELLVRLGGTYYKDENEVTERLREAGIIHTEADGTERLNGAKAGPRFLTTPMGPPSSGESFTLIVRDIFRNHHVADGETFSKGIARVYEGTGYPIAEDKLFISPDDALRLGVEAGQKIAVASREGSLEKAVTLKEGIRTGVLEYVVFRERRAALGLSQRPTKVIDVTVRKA